MNRLDFKKKLHSIIDECKLLNVDFERVYTVLSSTAQKLPSLNIEPFFSKLTGYVKEDFLQPEEVAQKLRDEAVELLQSKGTFKPDFRLLQQATRNALARMQLRRNMFVPIGIHEAVNTLPSETSSGFPEFHRPKSELREQVIAIMSQIIMNNEFDLIYNAMISYVSWRTQERFSGTKYRQFFIFPMVINAFENMFMRPIIYYYQNMEYSMYNSYSFHSDFREQKMIWEYAQNSKIVIGLDYSQYDLHVSQEMIAYSMYTIKSLFRLNWWQSVIFDKIILCHIDSYVVTNYQGRRVIIRKRSGVLSGSVFTNFLDTIINQIMLDYALLALNIDPKSVTIKVKGDDTLLISSNTQLRLNMIVNVLSKTFGSVIKPESCEIFTKGEPIFYLGYYFTNKWKLAQSTDLLLRKLVVSGRFFSEDEMPPHIRIISKAVSVLSNVTNGFELFFKYIWPRFKLIYPDIPLPKYYINLSERGDEQYMRQRNVLLDLKYGWMTK